ncbi:MAG: xanthine dehydrogenase family protein molybdopterin-binding subunit, partial [Alphaproteobacteria bacterium]
GHDRMAVRLQTKLGVVPESDRLPDSADTVLVTEPSIGAVARSKGNLYLVVTARGGGGRLSVAGRVRFDPDGGVTVFSGSMANGQGHETAFSQIVHEKLGLPFEKIRIVEGDTDQIPVGLGTGGSWSVPMGGGAIALAADTVIEKAKRIAAHLIEAAEADLEFAEGAFRVAGTDLAISIEAVARAALDPARLPPDTEPGLDAAERFQPENYTYPYGCHVCEVEVDPETGHVELVGYTAVHDFGRAVNPMMLAGQVHGGVAQGIGQALCEHTVYDADGQLLAGSYMDYWLPRAADLPSFRFTHLVSPSPSNPLDIKGCGEAGATGAPPAVINAILDALGPLGVTHIDMPATPERVWRAIREAAR